MRIVRPAAAAAPIENIMAIIAAAVGTETGRVEVPVPLNKSITFPIVNGIEREMDDEMTSYRVLVCIRYKVFTRF